MARNAGGAAHVIGTLADRIRDAASRKTSLRIVGGGTWLGGGWPVRAGETLSTRELTGIVDYVPGDLTLTARAGTPLGEIADATGRHKQWLALDPYGDDTGTIGATVATASAGPLSSAFGLPRDLVLGLEFVTGTGAVARGGGRVVKNVAGFDLTRLMTGSWGTLAVITEVTVRLHARPRADITLAVQLAGDREGAVRVRQLLRRLPFAPYACEMLDESSARAVTGASSAVALFRLGGNTESVRAQRASLAELGSVMEIDAGVWSRLRAEPHDAMVLRLSDLPSEIGGTWSAAMRIASSCPGTLVQARPARGVVRVVVPNTGDNAPRLARHLDSQRVTCIPERLSADLWRSFASPTGDGVSMRVKHTFDPDNVLNPGILGEAQ